MLKTILSFLVPTLLLAMGQIAAVAFGLAILWVAKRQGYQATLDKAKLFGKKKWQRVKSKENRMSLCIYSIAVGLALVGWATLGKEGKWGQLAPEMVSTAVAISALDWIFKYRSDQEYKRGIIRQLASFSNDFALEAARIATNEEWLCDGSLEKADLREANLRKAHLENARLIGVYLTDANLTGAKLWRANLTGADLLNANLEGAKLWRANLAGADLRRANLKANDLLEANLTGALYDTETQWPDNFDPKLQGAMHRDEMSAQEFYEWRKNFYN